MQNSSENQPNKQRQVLINLIIVFVLGIISIVILNYTTDIFKPQTIIKDGDSETVLPSDFPSFNQNGDNDQGEVKRLSLYSSFVMTQPITTDNIIDISHVIRVHGEIKSAQLNVLAGVTQENGNEENRTHTIYFYVDNGLSGGHLGAEYENGKPTKDFYTAKTTPFAEKYDLTRLPLSLFPNGPTNTINVQQILNDGKSHYVGAFVSTGIYGVLKNMWIEYQCVTEGCSIEIIR